jgi:hypothetical protein
MPIENNRILYRRPLHFDGRRRSAFAFFSVQTRQGNSVDLPRAYPFARPFSILPGILRGILRAHPAVVVQIADAHWGVTPDCRHNDRTMSAKAAKQRPHPPGPDVFHSGLTNAMRAVAMVSARNWQS